MIIVKIFGSLAQQLSQYAFGCECARLLNSDLKLDTLSAADNNFDPSMIVYGY
jgi:hypothetical protein